MDINGVRSDGYEARTLASIRRRDTGIDTKRATNRWIQRIATLDGSEGTLRIDRYEMVKGRSTQHRSLCEARIDVKAMDMGLMDT